MSESDKSNAELAREVADGWFPTEWSKGVLIKMIESALATAQSNLARQVLEGCKQRSLLNQSTTTDWLRDLFTRLNIEVKE